MGYSTYNIIEIKLTTNKEYFNPFTDVEVFCKFFSPVGEEILVLGFYDGDNTWKIRFTPGVEGIWKYKTYSELSNDDFISDGELYVEKGNNSEKGFLRAVPAQGWGLKFDSGEELLIIGDTMYNLFGIAHGENYITDILEKRKKQGFNLLRLRVPVSNFHPSFPVSTWHKKPTWLWGGSAECPDYGSFNLDYFKTIDKVMNLIEGMGFGAEIILEAWLFERPFNDRASFLPEYEELYIKYVVSRLSAYKSVYLWTTANEYNFHPKLDPDYNYVAEKYAKRLAKIIKENDAHCHPVNVHVTQQEKMDPSYKERFKNAKDIDILMLQAWGYKEQDGNSDLALGIDEDIEKHCIGSNKVNILGEYGYEDYPNSKRSPKWAGGLSSDHSRRGAWRTVFKGLHVIAGFENTWGVYFTEEMEPEGVKQYIYLKNFFSEVVDFKEFSTYPDILDENLEAGKPRGQKTLSMINSDKNVVLAYLPVGGECRFKINIEKVRDAFWYDNVTGEISSAKPVKVNEEIVSFVSAKINEGKRYDKDWVLVVNM
jgi:hypothetical protein